MSLPNMLKGQHCDNERKKKEREREKEKKTDKTKYYNSISFLLLKSCASLMFSPYSEVMCDLLLNRHMAKWNPEKDVFILS